MQNPDVARVFDEVADLLEIQGANEFRVRAYRNAARTLRDYPEPLEEQVRAGAKLTEIPGVGKDLAEKIATIVRTGTLPLLKELTAELPEGLLDLLRIPALGPKRVKQLYEVLEVQSAADLTKALDDGRVLELPGFGEKMVQKIRAGLPRAAHVERRFLLHDIEVHVEAIVKWMRAGGGLKQVEVAGSYRRRRETVGDLDILVTAADGARAVERFTKYPDVAEVQAEGPTRATVKLRGGLQVDLRAVEPAAYGAALMYFTGSKAHNVELRKIAQAKRLKLNEYGLFRGNTRVAGKTEKEIYAKLGLEMIPPELREARGEIALARSGELPHLVELRHIKGDMQLHTDATDGKNTMQEMVDAARKRGYAYLAVTDHSKRVTMALGLDPKRLRAQWRAIDKLNARLDGFRVLKSVELDILENGTLDLPDDVLAEADYVVATIHYGLDQPEAKITERLLTAVTHPWVDAIGHPTGRIVGERESYRVDFEAVAKAAAREGCLLELNGSERMDLPDTLASAAKRHGVRFVCSTDAHSTQELGFMRFAVDLARRAGLEPRDVVNTYPLEKLRGALKRGRRR